jgi:hypothetical protein
MPVLPFFAGLAVGVVALRLCKNGRLRDEIKDAGQKLRRGGAKAEGKLRRVAVSGLDALAGSSARLRDRLEGTSAQGANEGTEAEAGVAPEATTKEEAAPAKPRTRRNKPEGSAE